MLGRAARAAWRQRGRGHCRAGAGRLARRRRACTHLRARLHLLAAGGGCCMQLGVQAWVPGALRRGVLVAVVAVAASLVPGLRPRVVEVLQAAECQTRGAAHPPRGPARSTPCRGHRAGPHPLPTASAVQRCCRPPLALRPPAEGGAALGPHCPRARAGPCGRGLHAGTPHALLRLMAHRLALGGVGRRTGGLGSPWMPCCPACARPCARLGDAHARRDAWLAVIAVLPGALYLEHEDVRCSAHSPVAQKGELLLVR